MPPTSSTPCCTTSWTSGLRRSLEPQWIGCWQAIPTNSRPWCSPHSSILPSPSWPMRRHSSRRFPRRRRGETPSWVSSWRSSITETWDRTLAAFADLDARDQPRVVTRLAEQLARESPERAFEWFIGLDEEVRKDSFNWTLSTLHRQDPALTKELVRGVADPQLRIEAARAVTRPGNVGAEDLRWAESLGTEEQYAPVVGDVFYGWFGHDAEGRKRGDQAVSPGTGARRRPRPTRECQPLGFRSPSR